MPELEEMSQEMSPEKVEEIKDQIKKIEESILQKINAYNADIKEYEKHYNEFRDLESKGFMISKKIVDALKRKKSIQQYEESFNELLNETNEKRVDVLESQRNCLTQLQVLYKEHTDYLSQVVAGLKNRCEKLEEEKSNL